MDRAHHLLTAEGFLDLGMAKEAWDELDEIAPSDRAHPTVLGMRLRILEAMEQWQMGAEIAKGAVRAYPEEFHLRLFGATHIRQLEGLEEALRFLQEGASTFRNQPAFWFSMACLHCQLGDLETTTEFTRLAVDLDRSFQMKVLDHPDLSALRASWES